MSSYDILYKQYNSLNSQVKIEVKRIDSDGNYESTFKNVDDLIADEIITHDSIPLISYKLPEESFSFGILRVPDCTLKLLSTKGEFDNEENSNSIFNGFVRHKSLIIISHGYKDPKDDTVYYLEAYRGFINEKSKNTRVSNDNTYQNLFIEDLLTFLLKEHTFSEYSISATTLEAFILELFDRSDFTDFMTVSADNISAGYDIQVIDDTELEGQTQWLTILQDLSIGHSYLFQKAGVLFYQPVSEQSNTPILFNRDKIIKFESARSGIDEVFEKLFWKDSTETFVASTDLYNRSKTFDIETITDTDDRTNILAIIGNRTSKVRRKFKLKTVLNVNLNVLDRVRINAGDYETLDTAIWDIDNWDEVNWGETIGASSSSISSFWMIKEIIHSFQAGTTEFLVEEII